MAKARSPSQTKVKLIEAAHALIWANSYAHVSVDDICRAAGVQKGSFYHFFPTKSELAAAALKDKWENGCEKLDGLFVTHTEARAQLRAICREMLNKQKEALATTGMVCGCPYATLASEMSGDNQKLRQLSERMSESFRGYFERILAKAAREGLIERKGAKQRAHEMYIYALGAMLHARLTNDLTSMGKPFERAMFRISGIR